MSGIPRLSPIPAAHLCGGGWAVGADTVVYVVNQYVGISVHKQSMIVC